MRDTSARGCLSFFLSDCLLETISKLAASACKGGHYASYSSEMCLCLLRMNGWHRTVPTWQISNGIYTAVYKINIKHRNDYKTQSHKINKQHEIYYQFVRPLSHVRSTRSIGLKSSDSTSQHDILLFMTR